MKLCGAGCVEKLVPRLWCRAGFQGGPPGNVLAFAPPVTLWAIQQARHALDHPIRLTGGTSHVEESTRTGSAVPACDVERLHDVCVVSHRPRWKGHRRPAES